MEKYEERLKLTEKKIKNGPLPAKKLSEYFFNI